MRSPAHEEADALAGLLAGTKFTNPNAPPTANPEAQPLGSFAELVRFKIFASLVLSFAALLALLFLTPPLIEDWSSLAGAAAFASSVGAVAWAAARFGGIRLLGLGSKPGRQASLWGIIALGAMAWCMLSLALGGRLQRDGSPAGFVVAIGLVAILLQTAAEELFFRGWVQTAIERLARPSVALGITASLFAAVHLAGHWFAPLSLINILLAGLWFGLLAQHTGGLAAPIAAHWAWNSAEICIFGLYPNPGVGPWGALVGRDITGAPIWGGGEEGLNASILVSLTVGATVLLLLARRRGQFL